MKTARILAKVVSLLKPEAKKLQAPRQIPDSIASPVFMASQLECLKQSQAN